MSDWQTWVAYLVIGVALLWTVRRMWRVFRAGTRGGANVSCSGCPQNSTAREHAKPKPLVQLSSKRDARGD